MAHVKTVEQALETKTPSLGQMIVKYGVEKVEPYIKVWLINLNETLNLKRPLKEHQIDECAYLIVDGYRNITIADINIIFKRAKMGEYGELFESLSVDKILRWFKNYFNDRCNTAEAISIRQAEKHKYAEQKGSAVRMSQRGDEDYKKFRIQYIMDNANLQRDEKKSNSNGDSQNEKGK